MVEDYAAQPVSSLFFAHAGKDSKSRNRLFYCIKRIIGARFIPQSQRSAAMPRRENRPLVEYCQVKLGNLGPQFLSGPGETRAAFRKRLSEEVCDKRKFGRYAKCRRDTVFPPIMATLSDAGYFIVDGCHRTCAAAYQLRQSIDAIVFRPRSVAEEHLIFELALRLTEAGIHWATVVRLIARKLDAEFSVAGQAT